MVSTGQTPASSSTTLQAIANHGATYTSGAPYFVVGSRDSWALFRLPMRGEVQIGRGDECDLVINEAAASRLHAKVTMTLGEATIQDLGSRNGTFVNGERIRAARPLTPGDVVSICGVLLAYHASRARPQRNILELEQFHGRGEEEIERSLLYGRPLALVVATLSKAPRERAALAQILTGQLRLMDTVAWDGGKEVLLLLPETDEERAPHEAMRIQQSFARFDGDVEVKYAVCPVDGCDLAGLAKGVHPITDDDGAGRELSEDRIQLGDVPVVVREPSMKKMFALLGRLAAAEIAVLITGETGTGKELAALAIHEWSERKSGPFLTLNCAAIHETLVESELFGYERGAFSGAVGAKPGLLETANGGTVLLDEIGDLSAAGQAKLLRVLETKRVTRIGGLREHNVDIRIVAATNRDLEEDIEAGKFRKDLFFRLSGATVKLPPLRERRKDIAIMAEMFLDAACESMGRPRPVFSPDVVRALAEYDWPGNVRELKNVMGFLAATVPGTVVELGHIHKHMRSAPGVRPSQPAEVVLEAPQRPGGALMPIQEEVDLLIKSRMQQALKITGGNRTRAAELIKMPLRTFVAKIKQFGIGK